MVKIEFDGGFKPKTKTNFGLNRHKSRNEEVEKVTEVR